MGGLGQMHRGLPHQNAVDSRWQRDLSCHAFLGRMRKTVNVLGPWLKRLWLVSPECVSPCNLSWQSTRRQGVALRALVRRTVACLTRMPSRSQVAMRFVLPCFFGRDTENGERFRAVVE